VPRVGVSITIHQESATGKSMPDSDKFGMSLERSRKSTHNSVAVSARSYSECHSSRIHGLISALLIKPSSLAAFGFSSY
jgi:hypothetical protein